MRLITSSINVNPGIFGFGQGLSERLKKVIGTGKDQDRQLKAVNPAVIGNGNQDMRRMLSEPLLRFTLVNVSSGAALNTTLAFNYDQNHFKDISYGKKNGLWNESGDNEKFVNGEGMNLIVRPPTVTAMVQPITAALSGQTVIRSKSYY